MPDIQFIEDEPPPTVDDALTSNEDSAFTSYLLLIVYPIFSHEQVYDCGEGGSCASIDRQTDFDYVWEVNFNYFYPSLGTSYDMDLLDSINVNWDKDMDPTHNPRALSKHLTPDKLDIYTRLQKIHHKILTTFNLLNTNFMTS
jgi:hypothetical protein